MNGLLTTSEEAERAVRDYETASSVVRMVHATITAHRHVSAAQRKTVEYFVVPLPCELAPNVALQVERSLLAQTALSIAFVERRDLQAERQYWISVMETALKDPLAIIATHLDREQRRWCIELRSEPKGFHVVHSKFFVEEARLLVSLRSLDERWTKVTRRKISGEHEIDRYQYVADYESA